MQSILLFLMMLSPATGSEPAVSSPCQSCDLLTEIGSAQNRRYLRYKIDYDSLMSRVLIEEKTERYFAIVISYSTRKDALIQTRHLIENGYKHAGILKIGDRYAIFIEQGESPEDDQLINVTSEWLQTCGETSQAYIRKY